MLELLTPLEIARMFLSAIVKAHTDGLDAADVSTLVAADESEQPVARAPANDSVRRRPMLAPKRWLREKRA